MEKYKVLILTDHTGHSKENSLYAIVEKMLLHPMTQEIDIASRGNAINQNFFNQLAEAKLWIKKADNNFVFSENGQHLNESLSIATITDYDLVWLRMPPPLGKPFLDFLEKVFEGKVIINHPKGIHETGSKEFLVNFQSCCPPMKVCRTKSDIIDFKSQFPIVLKPFREYGGKGIVKITGDEVSLGKEIIPFDTFIENLRDDEIEYLGVKFLKNVAQGDKRIIVVNGKIMGASLRMPPENSWLCNVSMGGKAVPAKVDEAEQKIVAAIDPVLSKMGIAMYGVDTLVGDDGQRILSEINTTSIGGLPQMAIQQNQPLVKEAIDLIWQFFLIKSVS